MMINLMTEHAAGSVSCSLVTRLPIRALFVSFLVISLAALVQACGGGGSATPAAEAVPAVAPKAWQGARLVSGSEDEDVNAHQIAIDSQGNAIAVWSQTALLAQNRPANIMGAYYRSTEGWKVDKLTDLKYVSDQVASEQATAPQIAVDTNGSALTTWGQTKPGAIGYYAKAYSPSVAWNPSNTDLGTASTIFTSSPSQITAYAQGQATVAYGGNLARYSPSGSLVKLQDIPLSLDALKYSIVFATNSKGDAIAVFLVRDPDVQRNMLVASKRYQSTTGWSTVTTILSPSIVVTGVAPKLKIVLNEQGNAVATWLVARPSGLIGDAIYSSNFDASTGAWNKATRLNSDLLGTSSPVEVAMASNGDAIAIWSQLEYLNNTFTDSKVSVFTSYYTPQNGWGKPTAQAAIAVDASNTNNYDSYPHVAMNQQGTALIAWVEYDGKSQQTYVKSFNSANGWGEKTALSAQFPIRSSVRPPDTARVALNDQGYAAVAWTQTEGEDKRMKLWVNTFK